MEVATSDEIAEAIDIPSPIGTALCMAAASKKDHENGMQNIIAWLWFWQLAIFLVQLFIYLLVFGCLVVILHHFKAVKLVSCILISSMMIQEKDDHIYHKKWVRGC